MKAQLCIATLGILLLGLTGSAALAQDRGQDRNHTKFDDHDRQVTQDWYKGHQTRPPAGLRESDRLTPEYESRLQPGNVLDPEMRKRAHPAPADLSRHLPPPAKGHRYVAIGGHVAIVDHENRVQDVIHLHDR